MPLAQAWPFEGTVRRSMASGWAKCSRLPPRAHGTDGFFAAVLERTA